MKISKIITGTPWELPAELKPGFQKPWQWAKGERHLKEESPTDSRAGLNF